MGALNQSLFTSIVAMAVVTTMIMPPMLKWSLSRLPLDTAEKERLEREEFEAQGFVRHIERLLLAVDESPSGRLASRLAGLLAGVRRIPTTVLNFDPAEPARTADPADPAHPSHSAHSAKSDAAAAAAAAERTEDVIKAGADEVATVDKQDVDITTRARKSNTAVQAIAAEATKGYGLLIIGREPASTGNGFATEITQSVAAFGGSFAIAIARADGPDAPESPIVLVPITGTGASRDGAEVAIALAQAIGGSVTALYVTNSSRKPQTWRQQFGTALAPENSADAAVREIVELGEHYNTEVRGLIRQDGPTGDAILKEIESGHYSLLVMGVSPRPGDQLFLGEVAAEVLQGAKCSIVFVSGEHRLQ
jgi:nucleotide-binding universal stress UspA family protein